MAGTDRRVTFLIGANIKNFTKGLNSAQKRFRRFGRDMQRVGSTMSRSITLPLAAIGGFAIKSAADLDALRQGFTAITGSAEEATEQMRRLRQIGKLPSVDFMQAAKTSMAFQAIGKSAAFAERTITNVANAVALSGGGAEAFGGVMRQLRQVASLGRLMGEEMNTILENAPAMAKAIELAFGTTSTEKIREMGLTSEEFFERLNQGLEEMPKVTGGAKNSLENFRQAMINAAQVIGDVLLPVVIPIVEKASEFLEGLRGLNPEVVRMGVVIAGAAALIGPAIFTIGKLVTAISFLMNPIGLVVTAVAGLAIAIHQNWDEITNLFSDEGPEFMAPVRRALESITRFAATTFERLQTIFVKGIEILGGFWDLFGDDIIEFTKLTFQAVGKVVTIGLSIISTLLDVWSGRFLTDWDGFLSDIEESFIDIFGRGKSLEETFKGFFKFITSIPSPTNIGAKIGTLFGASLGIAGRQELGLPTPILDDDLKETEEKNEKTADKIFGIWDDLSKKLHNLDFTLPGFSLGAPKEQEEKESPVSRRGIPGLNSDEFVRDLSKMKAATTDFRSVSEVALDGLVSGWNRFKITAQKAGFDFVNFLSTQVASGITSFAESIGMAFSGAENEFSTGLERVLLLVTDFAKQLGTILIGIGTAIAFIPGLQGPAGLYIAGGAALVALATGVSAGIKKRISNREDRANQVEVPGMARGGIVPAGFPNDTFPAMLSSGETVIPAPKSLHSGRGQVIENILVLDGREIFRNQKEVKFRDER